MEEVGPTVSIIFAVLLLLNLMIHGFNVAIEYLNEKEIERRAQEEQEKKAIRLLKLLEHSKECRNATQFTSILTYVIMGFYCIDYWIPGVHGWIRNIITKHEWTVANEISECIAVVIAFLLMLYLIMIFGVLVPKKLAKISPIAWAYAGMVPVRPLYYILFPLIWFSRKSAYVILMLFGVNPNSNEDDVTEEEIIDMVNEGQEQGLLEAAEAEMISNIFEYREKEAQDIMTNRNNIIALDGDILLKEAINEVINGKQSRYPVYEENIDHIIGILHLKDAMRYHADAEKLNTPLRKIKDLLREPEFIPQTRNIDELFKQMQSKKLQMVIVIDEYGQTTGLVAMEDILEEIVGNIMDEYDEETDYIEEKGNNEYIIEGLTPLEELEERFGISFGEVEFETLNGFLISKMDKIPEENEQFEIEIDGYHFKILSVKNMMIHSVLVTRKKIETKVEEN